MSGVVHCRKAPYDLYIGRGRDPATNRPGEWGNPYSHKPSQIPGVIVVATLEDAIGCHERWLADQLRSGLIPLERMAELEHKTLGCWCKQPGPCHGHTLKRAARWAARELAARPAPRAAGKGAGRIEFVVGDLFEASSSTLVNAVNCRGAMGAGIAREFRRRYPAMYGNYRRRCARGVVALGRPYPWPAGKRPQVLNFPTKDDWREPSRPAPISEGLAYLGRHYREWGIDSLAVPALGCGLGGLSWARVRPVLERGLSDLDIPVLIFAPEPDHDG